MDEQPIKGYISEEVLKDKATHPAYMNLMFWMGVAVAAMGILAEVFMFLLAWNGKPVPEWLGGVPNTALLILGVLLVGEALLGKVTVSRNE